MTADLCCFGCNHRFGKRSRSIVLYGSCALCQRCANDPAIHKKLFFNCPHWHAAREHDGAVVTVGRARQLLALTPTQKGQSTP